MDLIRNKKLADLAREKAFQAGFDLFGIAPARKLEEYEPVLKNWLDSGMNGDMAFLERDPEKRLDPSLLFPGAKSVIVAGLNYYNEKKQGGDRIPVISRYAYGRDYHDVILKKLQQVLEVVRENDPLVNGRAFVDTAPIMEKAWAKEAGIGWQGRNSLVINNKLGSFFFLGILLLDIDLGYDKPFNADYCGECRLCIEACPTKAINDNRTINARKCISYQTIENKNDIPRDLSEKFEGRVFGCDICQEVCPWNKNARINTIPEFSISPELEKLTENEWFSMTRERFVEVFKGSPVFRIRYERMLRNIKEAFPENKKG